MSVLIVGSMAFDDVETATGKVTQVIGGAATYAAIAASLFTRARLCAIVGRDFPAHELEFMQRHGIDVSGVEIAEGKTFRWSGIYSADFVSRKTLDTQLNVFETFQPKLSGEYRQSDYVFLANIHPDLQLSVLEQTRKPRLVLCDTMNLWIDTQPDRVREVLRRVDVALMNDEEARQLCNTHHLVQAGERLLTMGPHVAVIKKGEHGALLFSQEDYFVAPSYPVDAILDPTGAGDAFAGGFVGYLDQTDDLSPQNLRKAVIYGSIVASFAVEAFSIDRLRSITPGDITARYDEFRKMIEFH